MTLISLVVGAYFGFNVWQKKVVNEPTGNSGVEEEENDEEGEA